MSVRDDIPVSGDPFGPGELDGLFQELEGQIEAERGPAAWLRSRSTRARVGLAVGLFVGLTLAIGLFSPRSDLSMLPPWRIAVVLCSLGSLFGASLWLELEPLHRASMPAHLRKWFVLAALAGMIALAWLPLAPPMPAEDPTDFAHAIPCLFGGLILAAPAGLLFRWLDRGGRAGSAYLSAAAAVLSANAAWSLHCENDSLLHILQGHAALGFIVIALVGAWRWATGRLIRPRPSERGPSR